jgi:hypothetical protein
MFCACHREFVSTHAAICRGNAPFGLHKILLEEALESGVERAFFNLEKVVGSTLNVLDEGVAMKRLALESAENHHFEGAGEEIALFGFFQGRLPKEYGGCVLQCLEQNSVVVTACQDFFLRGCGTGEKSAKARRALRNRKVSPTLGVKTSEAFPVAKDYS